MLRRDAQHLPELRHFSASKTRGIRGADPDQYIYYALTVTLGKLSETWTSPTVGQKRGVINIILFLFFQNHRLGLCRSRTATSTLPIGNMVFFRSIASGTPTCTGIMTMDAVCNEARKRKASIVTTEKTLEKGPEHVQLEENGLGLRRFADWQTREKRGSAHS